MYVRAQLPIVSTYLGNSFFMCCYCQDKVCIKYNYEKKNRKCNIFRRRVYYQQAAAAINDKKKYFGNLENKNNTKNGTGEPPFGSEITAK